MSYHYLIGVRAEYLRRLHKENPTISCFHIVISHFLCLVRYTLLHDILLDEKIVDNPWYETIALFFDTDVSSK